MLYLWLIGKVPKRLKLYPLRCMMQATKPTSLQICLNSVPELLQTPEKTKPSSLSAYLASFKYGSRTGLEPVTQINRPSPTSVYRRITQHIPALHGIEVLFKRTKKHRFCHNDLANFPKNGPMTICSVEMVWKAFRAITPS